MDSSNDVLVDLDIDEMIELKEIYRKIEEAYYVYTLIDQAIRWRLSGNERLRITSPNNAWKRDGSIITLMNSTEKQLLFAYSLDKTYSNIREGFMKTKRIGSECIFMNIHESYLNVILDISKVLGKEIETIYENNLYSLNIDKAASFQVNYPPGTYVANLDHAHVKQINELWPHRYEDSDKDVRMYIENNVGYGLFLETDHKLVAWVLQGVAGHINILQTEEEYRGRGYGEFMTRIMAKHIAQSGHVPVATVLVGNGPSNKLFRRIGFETTGKSYFIHTLTPS